MTKVQTPQTPAVTVTPRYRVISGDVPVIVQVQGETLERDPIRTLRNGDVLPKWTDLDQVRQLLEMGFIEVMS